MCNVRLKNLGEHSDIRKKKIALIKRLTFVVFKERASEIAKKCTINVPEK